MPIVGDDLPAVRKRIQYSAIGCTCRGQIHDSADLHEDARRWNGERCCRAAWCYERGQCDHGRQIVDGERRLGLRGPALTIGRGHVQRVDAVVRQLDLSRKDGRHTVVPVGCRVLCGHCRIFTNATLIVSQDAGRVERCSVDRNFVDSAVEETIRKR